MSTLAHSFASSTEFRRAVQAAIDETYAGTDYPRPDVDSVVQQAFGTVASDTRDRANDLAGCNKVDDCAAQALVLRRLADWLTT